MATAEQLRRRIARVREDGERLDRVDYFGRDWMGAFAGDVDFLVDCLEELLDQGVREVEPFATNVQRLLTRHGHIPMGGC